MRFHFHSTWLPLCHYDITRLYKSYNPTARIKCHTDVQNSLNSTSCTSIFYRFYRTIDFNKRVFFNFFLCITGFTSDTGLFVSCGSIFLENDIRHCSISLIFLRIKPRQDDQHWIHSEQPDKRKCTVLYGMAENLCPSKQCSYPMEVSLPDICN